jgi:hypothetical protein
MRLPVIGILSLGLSVLPAMARTNQDGGDNDEHRQLRELLASQSRELETTREQLQQLQRRMEFPENELRARSEAQPTTTQGFGNDQRETTNAQPPKRPDTPVAANDQEPKSDSIELANGKVRIGTLLYADYAYYPKTGFGPQFLSQINPPGPGNNSYNTFEISRAYINLFYSPTDAITFRLTPDLYRQIGAAPATKIGKVSVIGPNTDQGLPFRVKYAYVDFNTLLLGSEAFKKDKLTIGQQQDALIEWEERLYGYRFTSLVPWDYLGLPAAVTGIKLHGPVEFNGRQYLDYEIARSPTHHTSSWSRARKNK